MNEITIEELGRYQVCSMFTRSDPYAFVLELIKNNGSDEKNLVFQHPYHVAINAPPHGMEFTEIIFEWHEDRLSKSEAETYLTSKGWGFRNNDGTRPVSSHVKKIFLIAGMFEILIVCDDVTLEAMKP